MKRIISTTLLAAGHSTAELSRKISKVNYAPYKNGDEFSKIIFTLNGENYIGELKGRNRNLVLMGLEMVDQAIACRVFLDGDAVKNYFE
jgi:hypothetical protein